MCEHEDFKAIVGVARLTDGEGGKVTGFVAEIKIECSQCGKPFEFLGLEPGMNTQGANVSIDGKEAYLAITPEGTRPNPLQRMGFGISQFDG